MGEYYLPDGTGPFFTAESGVIPVGSSTVPITATGTTVDGTVVTGVRVEAGVLQIKTRTFTNGLIDGTESAWTSIYTL